MSNDRPIIAVRFHTPVTIGSAPASEWFESQPAHSRIAGRVKPRPGNPDLGEQRTSIVFEVRMGNANGAVGDIDVEVPASNLAEVQRLPPEPPKAKQPDGGKK